MMGKPDILNIVEREGIEVRRGKAFCPFHQEKTPSFTIHQHRQTFHCFGCGEGGDVITFIMKLKGITFKEALVYLGMAPGKVAHIDPDFQRRRKLQHRFDKAIDDIYSRLSEHERHLHRIRLQVKNNPGALTELGAAIFAGQMGELAEVEYKLDTLMTGTFEDQFSILEEMNQNDCTETFTRTARRFGKNTDAVRAM
jgi:DNA primase